MTERRIVFHGGIRTAIGFGLIFVVVMMIWTPLTVAVADRSASLQLVTEIGKFVIIAGAVLVLLRIDRVDPSELGLSRRHLVSALIAFGGLWAALNLLGFGIAVATNNRWAVGLIWYLPELGGRFHSLPASWLIFILLNFVVIGLVEEIAFRGYFQTKMLALLGDDSRLQTALAIVVTTVVFGLLHTPGAIIAGRSLDAVVRVAASPTLTALLFGVLYELTNNVYFIAFLHGLGNSWPLVIDWASWSGIALGSFWVGVAILYFGVTLGYRYWTLDTKQTPRIRRVEEGQSTVFE